MGHRSIQVTIDVYGHLIPGENVEWIDALDRASEKVTATDANRTQTQDKDHEAEFSEVAQVKDEEVFGLPPRDSNPDMLIQSQISRSQNKGINDLQSAKRTQTRQNTQTRRKRNDEGAL